MQIKISKAVLVKALAKVQGVANSRSTLPILNYVLIEATAGDVFGNGGSLKLTVSDLETTVSSSYAAEVMEGGSTCMLAKKAHEIVKELADGDVTISTEVDDWAIITSGKAKFRLAGLPVGEFPSPKTKTDNMTTILASTLADMYDQVYLSCCNDESKYNLNGIFMQMVPAAECGDGVFRVRMVATDGHRCSISSRAITSAASGLDAGIIIPKKSAAEMRKMIEGSDSVVEIGVSSGDNYATFKITGTEISIRLVDGVYPNFQRILPQNNTMVATINGGEVISTLRRMALCSEEKAVKFNLEEGAITFSSLNGEGGAAETIDVVYNAENLEAKFNFKYVIDMISSLGAPTVDLLFRDSVTPVVVKCNVNPEDFIGVVMPMRK